MSKQKIRVTLKTTSTNTITEQMAIWNEELNQLIYQEQKPIPTKVIYNYAENTLIRENEEINMKYSFIEGKTTIGIVQVKDLNQEIKVKLQTKKITKQQQNIEIDFMVEEEQDTYKIEVIK